MSVSAVVRKQIQDSGESVYKIAQGSGLTWQTVKRFVSGENIRTDHFDALCDYIGAELVVPKKPKGK